MREIRKLREFRVADPVFDEHPEATGRFRVRSANALEFIDVIASNTSGWDHVSASMPNRLPTWIEMEFIKRLFFRPEEAAMQLHPPVADYVDGSFPGGRARYCLHVWRPQEGEIPLPPRRLVGAKNAEDFQRIMMEADDGARNDHR